MARTTRRDPLENLNPSTDSKERIMLERVMRPMAVHSFPDTFSPKKKRAIMVVATISKLPNREALDAVQFFIPSIRKIGAAISKAIMPRV